MMIFNAATPFYAPLIPGQIPGAIMSSGSFHTLPLDLIHQDAGLRH